MYYLAMEYARFGAMLYLVLKVLTEEKKMNLNLLKFWGKGIL